MINKAKVKFEIEENLYYINKVTENKISFKRNLDQAVITFQLGLSFINIKQIFPNFFVGINDILRIINLRYGFAVVSIPRMYETFQFLRLLSFSSRVANVTTTVTDDEGNIRFFLPDEFTVQFQENLSDTEMSNIYLAKGCKLVVPQKKKGYFTLAVPGNKGLFEIIREFSNLEEVIFSEPCEVGANASFTPRSSFFNNKELWGLHNIEETIAHPARKRVDIKALEAWQIERGKDNVIIVVLDTGVTKEHNNLKPNVLVQENWEDRDFASPDTDPEPDSQEPDAHGTIVASIAAAADTGDLIGVAPECKIMPLRVDLDKGRYPDLVDAFNHVKLHSEQHPNFRYIINCSWFVRGDNAAIRRVIELSIKSNIVIVVAASNEGANLDKRRKYPMCYDNVIVVGAIDKENKVARWSSPSPGLSAYGSKVVWAPGKDILAIDLRNITLYTSTSVAAPFVSGLAALILSKNSNLSNLEVAKIIKETAESIVNDNEDFLEERRRSGETEISRESLGVGRINALEALKKTPNP